MLLALRSLEQMKCDEARDRSQVTIARQPNLLERLFCTALDVKAIHSNEHGSLLGGGQRALASIESAPRISLISECDHDTKRIACRDGSGCDDGLQGVP